MNGQYVSTFYTLFFRVHQGGNTPEDVATLRSRIEDTCLLLINSKKDSESGLLEGVVN